MAQHIKDFYRTMLDSPMAAKQTQFRTRTAGKQMRAGSAASPKKIHSSISVLNFSISSLVNPRLRTYASIVSVHSAHL